jgi:hypothetical protein
MDSIHPSVEITTRHENTTVTERHLDVMQMTTCVDVVPLDKWRVTNQLLQVAGRASGVGMTFVSVNEVCHVKTVRSLHTR